ncbi:MAG: glycosyltransferase [Chloroflexi bacterium]|nr:glycosyltransferase [Chloroflexota bacterium]
MTSSLLALATGPLIVAAVVFSMLLTLQAAYTVYLVLYTWDQPEAYRKARAPDRFRPPELSFAVLLPARHEEAVIQDTIQRAVDIHYPHHRVEIIVVVESGDQGTIARAQERIEVLERTGVRHVRLVTFDDQPINKPHGLNVAFRQTTNQVVTIFDAEDEIHPAILDVVNTTMLDEGVPVVQCGVQLMNYDSNWYSALNVLEYFFWFKSRLHYHARNRMIPLGGNTVFFRREVIEQLGGWDERNLTEDADIGIRISALGLPVRVVYDDRYVTKEETPPTVGQFIRQRTRWSQGFLQTLRKGEWRKLPTLEQRLLAIYTLAFPTAQALLALYVPVSLWMIFSIKMPILAAIVLWLPAYLVAAHFLVSLVGLYEFTSAHGLRPTRLTPLKMLLGYLPYQWLLGYAAIRATLRELRGVNNWEKTAHVGAHRQHAAQPASKA